VQGDPGARSGTPRPERAAHLITLSLLQYHSIIPMPVLSATDLQVSNAPSARPACCGQASRVDNGHHGEVPLAERQGCASLEGRKGCPSLRSRSGKLGGNPTRVGDGLAVAAAAATTIPRATATTRPTHDAAASCGLPPSRASPARIRYPAATGHVTGRVAPSKLRE